MNNTKRAEIRGGYDGVLSSALFNIRNTPVWADQAINIYGTLTGDFPNPVASLNAKDFKNQNTSLGGNAYLEYKFLKGFTAKSDFGYTTGFSKNKGFQSVALGDGRELDKNSLNESYSTSSTMIWNNTIPTTNA